MLKLCAQVPICLSCVHVTYILKLCVPVCLAVSGCGVCGCALGGEERGGN